MPDYWDTWLTSELEGIRALGRWRRVRPLDGRGPDFCDDGKPVVSFASNDYLGLSTHPAVVSAVAEAAVTMGVGSGSSRLIAGDRPIHHALEEELAAWRGSEAALVFPTGYAANLAVMTTVGPGARIISDELNHASIIDGARLSRAEVTVYRHGDVDEAAYLVATAPGRAVVVSDTVFSMDGDVENSNAMSAVCARHGALLVLDDAHAVFELPQTDPDAPCLRVGTLSKALGGQGGFVTGPQDWIDLLVNRGRSWIFTTGLAPAIAAGGVAAVRIVRSAEGEKLRERLRANVDRMRPGHPSPIVPIVIGDERDAVAASDKLLAEGILVPAIRPPTVPPGTSRLRVSLCAAHSPGDVDRLVSALRSLSLT